ncbi:MAG: hypothetical protein ABWY12_09735 [Burkholderiales bacterium]
MAQIHLNFYQRIILWNLIGGFQAPNMESTRIFLGLLKKIRPTGEEMKAAHCVIEADQYRWLLPFASYGERDLELESDEANALAQALESQQAPRVGDAEWMFDLIDACKAEKVAVGA